MKRYTTAIIVFVAALSIATLVYFAVDAARQFRETNESWEEYNKDAQAVSNALAGLQRNLGYGGFIHHFKNLILRRDERYITAIDEAAREVEASLRLLKRYLPSLEERRLIAEVQSTYFEYMNKKDFAAENLWEYSSITLDELVQVDDAPALAALARLQEIVDERSIVQEHQARRSFEGGLRTLKYGSFIVVLIIAGTVFILFLLRRGERARERLKLAFDHAEQLYEESPNALISVDEKGYILRINHEAERLLGYTPSEAAGMKVEKLMPSRFRTGHVTIRERYMVAPSYRPMVGGDKIYALTKDGRELRVDIAISHYTTVAGNYLLLAMTDMTQEYHLRDELIKARVDAEAATVAKSRFLASMSHEIRTPLNGILGLLQLIDKNEVSEEVARKLKIARESGLFLLTLINQVLDFSRIEAGVITVSRERLSLIAMMNSMQSMFKVRTDSKGVRFDCNIVGNADRFFIGDYDHIRQVLFNLTGNAVKFTDTGSISLLARIEDIGEKRCRVTFEVTDTGPGIAPEDIERVFEEFTQTDVGVRQGGGTGLGLNISKRLADAMDGRLSVRSQLGSGTTFTFVVELNVAEQQELVIDDGKAEQALPLRILVAEDNDINQMIIRSMLENDGHTVTLANNGRVAVELMREDAAGYDLVLMDVQMPEMDGIQATATIRQIVADADVLPIIALTANAFQDQKDEYISVGMQFVLTKPVDLEELRAALRHYTPAHVLEREVDHSDESVDLSSVFPVDPYGGEASVNEIMLDQIVAAMSHKGFSEIAHSLTEKTNMLVADLKDAHDRGDMTMQRRLLHELMGMLSNFGVQRASRMVAAMSKNIHRPDYDFGQQIAALEVELGEAWGVLEERVKSIA